MTLLQTHHTTTPTTSTAPLPAHKYEDHFPRLGSPKDKKFLAMTPMMAARAVLLELYPPRFVEQSELDHLMDTYNAEDEKDLGRRMGIFLKGHDRCVGWQRFQRSVNFDTLGHAAQELERAGYNWRQPSADTTIVGKAHEKIIQVARGLNLIPTHADNQEESN